MTSHHCTHRDTTPHQLNQVRDVYAGMIDKECTTGSGCGEVLKIELAREVVRVLYSFFIKSQVTYTPHHNNTASPHSHTSDTPPPPQGQTTLDAFDAIFNAAESAANTEGLGGTIELADLTALLFVAGVHMNIDSKPNLLIGKG